MKKIDIFLLLAGVGFFLFSIFIIDYFFNTDILFGVGVWLVPMTLYAVISDYVKKRKSEADD